MDSSKEFNKLIKFFNEKKNKQKKKNNIKKFIFGFSILLFIYSIYKNFTKENDFSYYN